MSLGAIRKHLCLADVTDLDSDLKTLKETWLFTTLTLIV